MAAPAKKREFNQKIENNRKVKDSDNSEDENDVNMNDEQGNKITVDFVGRIPEDSDFHGIKILLQQLFLKGHVNLGALADHIISRNYVGSVVKQGMDDDDEEDDDDIDVDDVFGITSVINISQGQNEECIQQLRELFKELAAKHASESTNEKIKEMLENDSTSLGLIINERFVNIPAEISVPLLENLIADMRRAVTKKMPYDFNYFILISKLYKPKNPEKKKKKKGPEEPDELWSNQEEEVFDEEALYKFEFPVEKDSGTGIAGSWQEDDDEIIPYRRVMIFEASKLQPCIEKIKTLIAN